jgi:pyruvate dehydrogenase E2 component (dihydrolipoamide acetyltransferase)
MNQRIFPMTMPKWGIEMQQGTVTEWHAVPGKSIVKGEPIVDVETDKIVNSVEAPVSGVLRLIVADKGAVENVGALIAVFADPSVPDAEIEAFVRGFKPADTSFEPGESTASAGIAAPAPAAAPGSARAAAPIAAQENADGDTRVSPIARRIAERLGVDLTKIKGTGRNGRVSKEDVEAYASARSGARDDDGGGPGQSAAPDIGAAQDIGAPPARAGTEPTRARLTAMRISMAKRLVESKQGIPHYRLAVDVDCSVLLSHRRQLAAQGAAVSVNDLLVRATALALVRMPIMNSHLLGDEVLTYPRADICIAVATDNGLMTPIVRAAESKSPAQIGAETRELARRARGGTLTREEITGGTFTISNLGMFGIDRFDAIINPPQVGILAVGAVTDRILARHGQPAVSKCATLTLSADHRVIDGAIGAQFLASLKTLIESASLL